MSQTEPNTVLVQAFVDRDFDTASGWIARVLGDAPFHGLFATGRDFADARRNIARVIFEAHRAFRPDIEVHDVLVIALTRKTFPVQQFTQEGGDGT